MKLYATVTSERDSRPAKKGGDNGLLIRLHIGNKKAYVVTLEPHQIVVYRDDGPVFHEFIENAKT